MTFGDKELERQDCVKYLGADINRDLSWKTHIERVRQQCMGKLATIRRAGAYLPYHIRKLLLTSSSPGLLFSCLEWLRNNLKQVHRESPE